MDPVTLEIFLAVARLQSFSQAAENLYMTQPAVSKRIAALETKLGSRLFDRVGHNIQLTAAGSLMQKHAREILQQVAFAKQAIQNLSGEPSGPLQIATGHHIGFHRLPASIKRLSQRYPNIELDIRFMDSEEAYQGILEGNLECAVLTLPEHPLKQVVSYPIWKDELALFCAIDHPLANLELADLKDLLQFPIILPEKHTFTRQQITGYFASHGLPLPEVKTGDYLETIRVLVECGLGWSLLPKRLKTKNLHCISVKSFQLSRSLGLIHHEKRPLSVAGKAFLNELTENSYED
ncbi:LysR family transcriptional regulator [Pleionea litopenaei]|uniref:LysR family transcriptional regulator n=1 Tax=Pleionea litopenaei TaxID=3070815 RepID=A0AA51RVD8_9GAMM|nr:LysR family transcriptional regulator [Pleionea sp. HL-JVS1]WMS88204.1 LysR family transcriptional regulator [Pleionea sp. HL-JVS1]